MLGSALLTEAAEAMTQDQGRPSDAHPFARAGLPYAITSQGDADESQWARVARTTSERLAFDQKVGVLVHSILGALMDETRSATPEERLTATDRAIRQAIHGRRDLGRGDRTRARISGLIAQYMGLYLPPAEAMFLGADTAAGRGRTDLAWRLPGVGIWFDELKTWRNADALAEPATREQVSRYLDHGQAAYGNAFAGVRLIALGNTRASLLFPPLGDPVPLSDSTLAWRTA